MVCEKRFLGGSTLGWEYVIVGISDIGQFGFSACWERFSSLVMMVS